jgi:hypothetical protein
MDFSLGTYLRLLDSLQYCGYGFQAFSEFVHGSPAKSIVLRQNVDSLPQNSHIFARIKAERGIKGISYFWSSGKL